MTPASWTCTCYSGHFLQALTATQMILKAPSCTYDCHTLNPRHDTSSLLLLALKCAKTQVLPASSYSSLRGEGGLSLSAWVCHFRGVGETADVASGQLAIHPSRFSAPKVKYVVASTQTKAFSRRTIDCSDNRATRQANVSG